MELYHFTSVPALHQINESSGINEGYLQLANGDTLRKHSWYTTSPSPIGHGLTNGNEVLSDYEKSFFRKMNGLTDNDPLPPLHNKRAIRIKVNGDWLLSQSDFHKYTELLKKYKQPEDYALRLGITGLAGHSSLNPEELKMWASHPGLMHNTWYVHTGILAHDKMCSIEFLEEDGNYREYDFEKHGRAEMARYGSFSISEKLLRKINSLSDLNYREGNIFCFYRRGISPQICFFHKSQALSVFLDKPNFVRGPIDRNFYESYGDIFLPWVNENIDELRSLWHQCENFWIERNGNA